MTTSELQRENLRKAIRLLGGLRATARLIGVSRGAVDRWQYLGWPAWREHDVGRILKLAADPKNHVDDTPAWAVRLLRERKVAGR